MTTPTTVNVRLQLRADTAANWTAANPTLLANEVGLETDTKKLKVGNGSSAWNSLAYFPSIVSGGTVLGNLEIGSTGTLTFEGSTADGFETTLAVTNPTADRTITLPNQSGTVVVSGNASIVDADIAANAEIAVSKLADGAARQLLQTDAAGTGVEWTSNVDIPGTLDVTSTATFDSDVVVTGNLTVNGTTTNINTQNLVVEDKNIILGDVPTPSDTTADGGGITLKGATDKTINWVDATDAWTSSEHINIASGKEYRIAGTSVLSGTNLGTGITVGASQLSGTIPSGVLSNSSLNIGTTSVALNRASANQALTGISSIGLPGSTSGTVTVQPSAVAGTTTITLPATTGTVITTGDTGTVTSTMIADGTIVNGDISASAAIAGTKISPDFGNQNVTTTGVISAAAGAAGTPSIAFTGDLNTGIYSPGADQVAISTNGTGRLFVDANGRVSSNLVTTNLISQIGLGADDANNSLASSAAGISIVNTNSSAFNRTGVLTFGQGAYGDAQALASVAGVYTNYTTSVGGALVFSTNNGSGGFGERLRITSDGKVGVGTSSPTSRLDVAGYTKVGNYTGTFQGLSIQNNNDSSGAETISFLDALNNLGTIDSNLFFGHQTDGASYITLGTTPAGSRSSDRRAERVRITGSGNVGIGTASPSEILQVAGAGRYTGGAVSLDVNGAFIDYSSNIARIAGCHSAGGVIAFYTNPNAAFNTERARIDSSGRLLVGTSSDSGGALLQVNGDRIRVATAKTPASATATGTAGEICWDASYVYVCTATNTWKRAALSTW